MKFKWRNHELCRAHKIYAAVAAEPRRDAGVAGSNDQSLLSLLDQMRESGHAYGNVDDSRVCTTRDKVADDDEDVHGKLDLWVKESINEILTSLDEAPFLVHIYSDGEDGLASKRNSRKLVKERAGAESWSSIKQRWNGEASSPNGVILVGEIDTGDAVDGLDEVKDEAKCGSVGVRNKASSSTKVWGILIQGKGGNYPACYILKTSRVKGVSGFCTHFCLVRVECFVEHVDIQFKKLWLL